MPLERDQNYERQSEILLGLNNLSSNPKGRSFKTTMPHRLSPHLSGRYSVSCRQQAAFCRYMYSSRSVKRVQNWCVRHHGKTRVAVGDDHSIIMDCKNSGPIPRFAAPHIKNQPAHKQKREYSRYHHRNFVTDHNCMKLKLVILL